MACSKLLTFFLYSTFVSVVLCKGVPYGCGPSVISAGYTVPMGDITLKEGEDLDIFCILNESAAAKYGTNGSNLMHYRFGNATIESEIVNSTAIRLHIKNHPKTKRLQYACMIDKEFVCHNVVVVGTPPQDVTNFDCIGNNYENFTCSWTAPNNFVNTDYTMAYAPSSQPTRYNKSAHKAKSRKGTTSPTINFAYSCPNKIDRTIGGKRTISCTWSMGTTPQYRHSHDNFTFKLTASNTFGNKTWEFPIQHFTRVRPNPPEDLHALKKSPSSIKLSWTIPLYMQSFPKGIKHRVSWWIEQNKKWTTIYLPGTVVSGTVVEYELTDLPYAHCLYDIRVSMKSSLAKEERMWSQNNSITVWTLSKIPDCPPNTTTGSFELSEGTQTRLVRWQNIHNYQENGENFSYTVEIDGVSDIQPVKAHSNYATFENLPDRNYTFKIWSQNSEGKSENFSVVFFPAKKYTLRRLSKLVKVDKVNGEYDLEWTESSDQRVQNYTLFWCAAQKERPHPCEGTLQWETVPRGVKNKTLTLATQNEKNEIINIYQFAISANGHGTSSGLLWADCTVIPGTGVKLTNTHVNKVGSRYILLHWKLDCIKLGNIKYFNVSYCTIANLEPEKCLPNSQKYKLFNNNVTFGMGEGELNITGLKPYTGYQIQVRPIVIGVESEFSDPMYNTTWEDTPTPPRNLRVLNRTDRSISIQWEKPLEENGHLNKYFILIDGRPEITVTADREKTLYSENIVHLLPRTNYTIGVKACTTSCSISSIDTSTDIGYPGIIPKPSANWDNYSLIIKWDRPDEIGVKVDFYEIQVGTLKGSDNYIIDNSTEQFYKISICQHDKSQTVFVKIRAVNVKDGRLLQGGWSEKADFPCFRSPNSSSWVIPLVVMSVIVFIVLMFYLVKKIWRKIVGMRNCPVKLPPGLDAVVNDFVPKEKHSDETLPGEPLLPEKFSTQPKNLSGETSGCSSGSESVSSSVQSAGRLSGSDSGTEQPVSPSLGESTPRDLSLRQRPNVKKMDYVAMSEIPQASWSTKPTQSGYSVIGLSAPPKKPDIESEFMPLSDSGKSSYVPFSMTQSQEPEKESVTKASPPTERPKLQFPWQQGHLEAPSSGYVLVGDTKLQKPDLGIQKAAGKDYLHNVKSETAKSLKED